MARRVVLRTVLVFLLAASIAGAGMGGGADGSPSRFSSTCPSCERVYRVPPPSSVEGGLTVRCSPCDRLVDVRQPDTEGRLRRPPWFLQSEEPAPGMSPADLMNWIRLHVRYVRDDRFHRLPEAWQLPAQTYRWRRGDCEDSSILLAEWLNESGYEAYVVAGRWRGRMHTWVVLRDEGTDYLLETTTAEGGGNRILPLARLMTDYNPTDFMFDDGDVWARRTRTWTADYRSDDHWYALRIGGGGD
jgi:hypothetical protein